MKKEEPSMPKKLANRRPNWRLLEEKAITVEFSLGAIASADRLGFRSRGFKSGRLFEENASAVSRSIAEFLSPLAAEGRVDSVQANGEGISMNTLTADGVQVSIIFKPGTSERFPSPELSVKILGEGKIQEEVAEKIRRLKSSLEQG